MVKKVIIAVLLQSLIVLSLNAEKFEFLYTPGHTYTVYSTVNQEVFVNDVKSHDVLITNDVIVKEVDAHTDGSGTIEATYNTSELATFIGGLNQSFTTSYESVLYRDKLGNYSFDENTFMPVVRNLPIFPDRNLELGDTWTAQGEEFHDFRENFGIEKPFRIPFTAHYTYDSTEEINGKTFHVIIVEYNLEYESPETLVEDEDSPALTKFTTMQTLYWDNENGYLDHYSENYDIAIETKFGYEIHIIGETQTETANFISRAVSSPDINTENTYQKAVSIESIQFEPNTAELTNSAKNQLQRIKQQLESLPRSNLLLEGHTALAGTEGAQLNLSQQRAKAVADYLVSIEVRTMGEMEIVGLGSTKPIAPNTTHENMIKNRRVEITILNN